MVINKQRREELLSELIKIDESGPIVGEDEARRYFFISQELEKAPESDVTESLVELFILMSDDGYREDSNNR